LKEVVELASLLHF